MTFNKDSSLNQAVASAYSQGYQSPDTQRLVKVRIHFVFLSLLCLRLLGKKLPLVNQYYTFKRYQMELKSIAARALRFMRLSLVLQGFKRQLDRVSCFHDGRNYSSNTQENSNSHHTVYEIKQLEKRAEHSKQDTDPSLIAYKKPSNDSPNMADQWKCHECQQANSLALSPEQCSACGHSKCYACVDARDISNCCPLTRENKQPELKAKESFEYKSGADDNYQYATFYDRQPETGPEYYEQDFDPTLAPSRVPDCNIPDMSGYWVCHECMQTNTPSLNPENCGSCGHFKNYCCSAV